MDRFSNLAQSAALPSQSLWPAVIGNTYQLGYEEDTIMGTGAWSGPESFDLRGFDPTGSAQDLYCHAAQNPYSPLTQTGELYTDSVHYQSTPDFLEPLTGETQSNGTPSNVATTPFDLLTCSRFQF